jgi:hypothetical protein
MIPLAVVALAVGVWLSRNSMRSAEQEALLPPRADCRRFPGACAEGVPDAPPAELAALHAQVVAADSAWRAMLERNARTGVFPEKGLAAMREALAVTESAIGDARFLVARASSSASGGEAGADNTDAASGSTDVSAAPPISREAALEVLRTAYEQKLALLTRATRLLEDAT